MTIILAADIGVTKTLLQLSEFKNNQYQLLCEHRYVSSDYDSFDDVLTAFRKKSGYSTIDHACFAIAGPISNDGENARVTNLPWSLDRQHLTDNYAINDVQLINDFHAVAVGIDTLADTELLTLQEGKPQHHGPQLVIGAGTGLGVALRVWNGKHYQVLASEAGHAGFAPADLQQRQLLDFVSVQHPLVSREYLLSGQGLVNIYRFICDQQQLTANNMDAENISQLAQQGDKECRDALMLFFVIYGSEAGNLALATLPFAGVYIAGGIAAKNIEAFTQSDFIKAFSSKNKMQSLLSNIPIHVIKNELVGLHGARCLASQQ